MTLYQHKVFVTSNDYNRDLLKALDLKFGRDYLSVRGAAQAGKLGQLCLMFKDRDLAIMFKLRSIA